MDTKQLRQKVLDLAIRGKLVPQNPNDEPASVLLERIREEKERQIKEGKIKRDTKEKTGDKFPYQNVPFEVPEGWVWVKVKDIGEVVTGNTPSKDNKENYGNDYPFYKPTDLEQGISVTKASDNLSLSGYSKARQLPVFSILVTCIGATIGKTGLILKEGTCNQQINAIIPNSSIEYKFLYYSCISDYFQNQIEENASATTLPIINKSKFEQLLFSLPPLAEQKLIIQKIEEYFALIDQIEDNKLSLFQFIKQTKSKVLDLAIRGKLVPQDPNDEPASVLLEKIRNERKEKNPASDNSHYPFEAPKGWAICSLSHISKTISSKPFQILQSEIITEGKIPVVSQSINIVEGYSNNSEKSLEVTTPLIIFGDHTRIVKYIDFNFIVGADGVKIIKPNNIYPKYFYYLLLYVSHKIEDRGYSRHFQFIEKFPLAIPPLAEQHRIVQKIESIFRTLDSTQNNL